MTYKVDDEDSVKSEVRIIGLEAYGLKTICGAWSMVALSDGFVAEWYVQQFPRWRKLAAELERVGHWKRAKQALRTAPDVVLDGWVCVDWKLQESATSIIARREADRARKTVNRDKRLRNEVRGRDGGRCRYCGIKVQFSGDEQVRYDRDSGTFDHVDPNGPSEPENLVTSCRGCNSRKGRRTPAEAGMVVLPIGTTEAQARALAKDDDTPQPADVRPGVRRAAGAHIRTDSEGDSRPPAGKARQDRAGPGSERPGTARHGPVGPGTVRRGKTGRRQGGGP